MRQNPQLFKGGKPFPRGEMFLVVLVGNDRSHSGGARSPARGTGLGFASHEDKFVHKLNIGHHQVDCGACKILVF